MKCVYIKQLIDGQYRLIGTLWEDHKFRGKKWLAEAIEAYQYDKDVPILDVTVRRFTNGYLVAEMGEDGQDIHSDRSGRSERRSERAPESGGGRLQG